MACVALSVVAQPAARRQEQQKKEHASLLEAQDKLDDVINRESNVFIVVTNIA